VGNRVWGRLGAVAPDLAARLASGGGAQDVDVDAGAVGVADVRVVPAEQGAGGSLVAVVRR
jgi:hypothetical protein